MTLQDLRMKIHSLGVQIESALAGRPWRQLPEAELERLDPVLESLDEAMTMEAEAAQRGDSEYALVGDTAARGEQLVARLNAPGQPRTWTAGATALTAEHYAGAGLQEFAYKATARPRRTGQGRSFVELFGPTSMEGWKDASEYLGCILRGEHDARQVTIGAAMDESARPAHGGYLVPSELERRILDVPLHQSVVLPRCTIVPMAYRTKMVAGYAAQDQSNSMSMFGFTYKWLQENQSVTPGIGNVRALELTARPLGTYVAASNEVYSDVDDFESLLEGAMGVGAAEALDDAFLNGTGLGMPLGIFNCPALLSVTKVTAQVAATVVYQNILDILSRHCSPQTAVWVVSPTTIPQLFSLTVDVGAGGSYVPLVQVGVNGEMTMLGRPLVQSHRCPVVGTVGDVGLYSFEWYYAGIRKGMAIERSAHVGFTSNQTTWRLISRVDGMPRISTTMTGADSITYSPFVVVQTRS